MKIRIYSKINKKKKKACIRSHSTFLFNPKKKVIDTQVQINKYINNNNKL